MPAALSSIQADLDALARRMKPSVSSGCLSLLGLFVGCVAAQILSGILADAGAGLLSQIGLAVVFGQALWLGMRAWQRRTARSIADVSALAQI